MRMELSRKADYAVRASLALARRGPDARVSSAALSADASIPGPFAPRVLGSLVRAGVVSSKEGAGGGYRLARPAAQISLLDVVEAVEGRLKSTRCVLRGSACSPQHPCSVHPAWAAAQEAMRESLAQTSIAELL